MSDERQPRITDHESLLAGVRLFNDQKFWHAHEAWERIWLTAEPPEKIFLQGLIQLAAAYHHVQRGTFRGGARLFAAAFAKLAPYPVHFLGIDREDVIACAKNHRERITKGERIADGELPKFRYNELFADPTESSRHRG